MMKPYHALVALASLSLTFSALAMASVPQPGTPHEDSFNQHWIELSKQHTSEMRQQKPEVGAILDKLGLKYLHELDPTKVYNLNLSTSEVTVMDARSAAAPGKTVAGIGFGFASPTTKIFSVGQTIQGQARTVVTCPFSAQTAEVSGFMASTVARDPLAGIRQGTLQRDDWVDSISEVNFSILRVPGGARNPINRTVMETTHAATCGSDVRLANLVSTWPPLRTDMVIDDTGSMGEELSGVKSALATFIASQNQDPLAQRGISYELITFKDEPSLVLPNTEDASAATAAVQSLYPSGGNDCPEDAIGGLSMALGRMSTDENSEGAIILVTDASPRGGNVDGVISAARASGIKVHVMLSGDCAAAVASASAGKSEAAATVSARAVFERIANETGGRFFYQPGGTAQDYSSILTEIFNGARAGEGSPPPACLAQVNDYNLFLLEDYQGGHDVSGKVAAGGHIAMTDFSVGAGLPDSDIARTLVAGGNLTLSRGGVLGEAFYGGDYSANTSVVYRRGIVARGTPIDFTSRFAGLRALSAKLGTLTTNGTTRLESWGGVMLGGTDPAVNVFNVDASALTGAKLFSISAPAGSLAVVNIHGSSATFQGFGHTLRGGIDPRSVVYNFVDATGINASGFTFLGTLLAPYANVTFNNGSWNGGLYARSLTGNASGRKSPLKEVNVCN